MIRVRLIISGQVQGVFFRARAQRKAQQLGDIYGWVANESDGTVTVVAEGPENKMNDLVDWCHSGPSTAQVKNVKVEHMPYQREFSDFSVRF